MSKDKKTQTFTISNLKFLMEKNKLNFNPDYQRDYVWKKSQKELFIDSLILGYDIPKIYFHEKRTEMYDYDVVDGQQRLLTIKGFLDNSIKLPQEADDLEGEEVRNKYFNDLSTDLQMYFNNINLDIVILNKEYDDDDIKDMFLRYQNGEPLNAAEKRKAIPGKFKSVVKELAQHRVFNKCGFSDNRDAFQDAIAKILHIRLNGDFTTITPDSIKRTYANHSNITEKDKNVSNVQKTLNFIDSSFEKSSNKTPKLKKYAILTLAEVAHHLLENYTINNYKKEFAESYLEYEKERALNNDISDENYQDASFNAFTDAARGDSPAQQKYRFDTLLNYIIASTPNLTTKDPKRLFTVEQKIAIYRRDNGTCQNKACRMEVSFDEFEADHIKAHSKGGETKISNGQVLCSNCNSKKRAR
jgi:Protein of unknown function DUF262/HNH endonuclease